MEPGGYAWWYVDALSSDGRHGLTMIAFIGSVFSPYYARARTKGRSDPCDHCAINIALYGAGGKRWAMTERGRPALDRGADWLVVGPSGLEWDRDGLTIWIDEWSVPIPRRVKGRIRLTPSAVVADDYPLDRDGRHVWRPIAPLSHVEADFEHPRLSWSGSGYLDHNRGSEPLERGFSRWDWSRTAGGASTRILYDATTRQGEERSLGLAVDGAGRVDTFSLPPRSRMPPTLWRIGRTTRADATTEPRVAETLEDTPFYARSLVETTLGGERWSMFHESLDLDRFSNPVVQAMLPFRMPRRARW